MLLIIIWINTKLFQLKLFVMDINHILIAPNSFYLRALLCVIVNRKRIVTLKFLSLLVSFDILIPSNKALPLEKLLSTLCASRCIISCACARHTQSTWNPQRTSQHFQHIIRLKVRLQEHVCSFALVHLEMKWKKAKTILVAFHPDHHVLRANVEFKSRRIN